MSLTPQEIASEAAHSLDLEDGGRIIRPAQIWRQLSRFKLVGDFECAFSDLPGTHRIPVTAHFDEQGRLHSVVARDPLFGDPIGAAQSLPDAVVEFLPDAAYYADLGLWLDESADLVWVPGIWGRGNFTFDSAQRLPDRLAEDRGYKGFFDWRMPTRVELNGLCRRAHDGDLMRDGGSLAELGQFVEARDANGAGGAVWTSDSEPQSDWAKAYQFSRSSHSGGSSRSTPRDVRLPIILVRDALEDD